MTDDRIAKLEATINAAQAELAEIKAGKAEQLPPRPPRDEGVRVVPLLDERVEGVPNLKELQRLFEIVRPLAPWPLADRYDERKPFRGFCSAFRWISNKGRTDFPNPKFALSFWLDNAKTWLRDRNAMGNDIDASTLILATYASGDVKFLPANAALGHTWEIGIAEYSGRPATDAWRPILAGGAAAILPPSAPARRMAPPSPVRVIVGGY
jgi:hypothetical protein